MLLAGDIGGTKTELALYTAEGGPRAPHAQARFPSANYPGLSAIVREFLAETGASVEAACLAVAGPVVAGQAKITNLPWAMSEAELSGEFGLRAMHLLNDLEAIAWAVPTLEPADLTTLNTGVPIARGAIGVIAPGTGLGEAFLTWDGTAYRAHASEGGHADFAPADALQAGLLAELLRKADHVSYEHICSGIGLPTIYGYLRDSGHVPEAPALIAALTGAADATPAIVAGGMDPAGPDPLCRATLDLFVAVLGAEAGNLALKVLATGGVYVAGGIPPRIAPLLEDGRFMGPFQRKGRFAALLAAMPVYVITSNAALLGAAHHGLQLAASIPTDEADLSHASRG